MASKNSKPFFVFSAIAFFSFWGLWVAFVLFLAGSVVYAIGKYLFGWW